MGCALAVTQLLRELCLIDATAGDGGAPDGQQAAAAEAEAGMDGWGRSQLPAVLWRGVDGGGGGGGGGESALRSALLPAVLKHIGAHVPLPEDEDGGGEEARAPRGGAEARARRRTLNATLCEAMTLLLRPPAAASTGAAAARIHGSSALFSTSAEALPTSPSAISRGAQRDGSDR